MFKVTWGCNGEPPIGSVECDTRENAEALRARLPYPVVSVVRTDAPEERFELTWDRAMSRPMAESRAADALSQPILSPFVRNALARELPAKVVR